MRLRPPDEARRCGVCGYQWYGDATAASCPECGANAAQRASWRSWQSQREWLVLAGTVLMAPGWLLIMVPAALGGLGFDGKSPAWLAPEHEQLVVTSVFGLYGLGLVVAVAAYLTHLIDTRAVLFRRRGIAEAFLVALVPVVLLLGVLLMAFRF